MNRSFSILAKGETKAFAAIIGVTNKVFNAREKKLEVTFCLLLFEVSPVIYSIPALNPFAAVDNIACATLNGFNNFHGDNLGVSVANI